MGDSETEGPAEDEHWHHREGLYGWNQLSEQFGEVAKMISVETLRELRLNKMSNLH